MVAGDVFFDIRSIGDRYGKFGGAADSQGEPCKCFCLLQLVSVILFTGPTFVNFTSSERLAKVTGLAYHTYKVSA